MLFKKYAKIKDQINRILNYRDYNIRPKLLSIIGIFMFIFVLTIGFIFMSLKNIQTANKNKNLIIFITKYAQEMIYDEKDYLNKPSSYMLTKYSKSINKLTVAFNELKKYYNKKEEIDFILGLIKDHMDGFFIIAEGIEDSKTKGYSEHDLSLLIEDAKSTLAEKDKEFFTNLLKFNKKFSSLIDLFLKKTYRNIYILTAIILSLFVIIALFIYREINFSIIHPIKNLSESMKRFGEGELDVHATIIVQNEIGSLAKTFNEMVISVKESFHMRKFISNSTLDMIHRTSLEKIEQADNKTIKKEVAIFFSDMRGFTSMSETKKPETVIEILNQYLDFQTRIIQKYKGDVDKFVGDEIVAVFTGDKAADNAVEAGIEIQKKIIDINKLRKEQNKYTAHFGIGINYGNVIMGSIGSDERKDFTIIGDNVNLAARLCSAAKVDEIIIAKSLRDLISLDKKIVKMEPIFVKGKQQLIDIYRVEF